MMEEIKRFLKRVYPPFVTAVKPASFKEEVPVFMFHTVTEERFKEQLTFLADNGYYTLAVDELFNFIVKGGGIPAKSILLTFDDGERSLYSAAFPLLKEFGFKAAAFIVPSFIREGEAQGVGVENGKGMGEGRKKEQKASAKREQKRGGEKGEREGEEKRKKEKEERREDERENGGEGNSRKQWLSWNEVSEMEKSGVIDFQSHTLNHERMFIGNEIIDFYHPGIFADELGLDVPTVVSDGNYCRLAEFGAPVYVMGSRMGEALRYFDDEKLRVSCVQYVKEHGGTFFFNQRGWRLELRRFFKNFIRENAGHFESNQQRIEAISNNLKKSKEILQERLGKEISHLAYPWGYGSKLSVELSESAEYKTNFWGPLRGVRINKAGGNPYYISRLKDDYLFRLPGNGRKSLIEIFKHKLVRRVKMKDIY